MRHPAVRAVLGCWRARRQFTAAPPGSVTKPPLVFFFFFSATWALTPAVGGRHVRRPPGPPDPAQPEAGRGSRTTSKAWSKPPFQG
eukprot:10301260-Alexandrium_andersonii.AAC.1